MATVLAIAGPVVFFTGALSVMRSIDVASIGRLALWWTAYAAALWLLIVVGGALVERIEDRLHRALRWPARLACACIVSAAASFATAARSAVLFEQGLVASELAMHLHAISFSAVMTLLYFVHVERSRQHRRAFARLAAAQAAQRHARREIVEARLHALQARIDPGLLFALLETVGRIYERDAGRGERYLDQLIAFLRAALPRAREPSSSLVHELALVRSLVELHALASDRAASLTLDVAPAVTHARYPSGVLLPLVAALAADGAGTLAIGAVLHDARCRVVLEADGRVPDDILEPVRALLRELNGELAALEMASVQQKTRIVLTVPHECA